MARDWRCLSSRTDPPFASCTFSRVTKAIAIGLRSMDHEHFLCNDVRPDGAASSRVGLFEAQGFCVWERFLTPAAVSALETEIARLTTMRREARTHGVVLGVDGLPMVMNRIDRDSDLLFDLHRHPALLIVATTLLQDSVVPLHVEYFAKRGESNAATPPHQDAWFYREHFSEMALAIWLPLDDVGPSSGALEYALPSPMVLLPHGRTDARDFDGALLDDGGLDNLSFVPALVPSGGCVAHIRL